MNKHIKLFAIPNIIRSIYNVAMISQCGNRVIIEYTNGTSEEGEIDSKVESWDLSELIKVIQTKNFTKAIK